MHIDRPGTPFKINWVHSVMKYAGQLPENWELTQCLFGEHLLSAIDEKQKTVALVESEKTAIIASCIMPKYIWLATGGKSQFNHIDIADWLIKWRQDCIRQFGGTDAVPFAGHNHGTWDKTDINPENCPTFANPNMQLMAKYFPSEHLSELEELIDELDLIPTTLRIADPI